MLAALASRVPTRVPTDARGRSGIENRGSVHSAGRGCLLGLRKRVRRAASVVGDAAPHKTSFCAAARYPRVDLDGTGEKRMYRGSAARRAIAEIAP